MYRNDEIKRKYEKFKKGLLDYNYILRPYPKKIERLNKIIQKYNLDVYIFSAWTQEELENIYPFKISGDTNKNTKKVIEILSNYDIAIMIDDEVSYYKNDFICIEEKISFLQPYYEEGMVLKDFKKLENIIKGFYDKKK